MTDTNTTLDKDAVLELLKTVDEPEIGQNLVELKMVKDVVVDGGKITVHIELPTPASTSKEPIQAAVTERLTKDSGASDVEIVWTSKVRSSGGGRMDAQPIKGVKNAVAVASGKGGVGKSTVAVNIAVALARTGASVGLLDADVYGPSIPLMMGTHDRPIMRDNRIIPIEAHGVKLMSIGFILDPEKALIWRGPLVAQLITQFLNDVDWGDLDYLIIDLPPGTGDAQLTLVQRIPISGAVIVTTPQDVALADALKGLKMFEEVKTPILGIVENMSGFVCPDCGASHDIFASGGGERIARENDVELLGKIPLEPLVRAGGDIGQPIVVANPDTVTAKAFDQAAARVATRLAIEAVKKPRKPTIMLKTV
ncbi:MAG: iron-sulfur cluster carrier protein ApbC [Thermomicrobiales bacterium]|nr:iron-sulfur cluster carrier protein ApbC [Thermomicrobiales bacterium]